MLCERVLEHSNCEESELLESLDTEGRTRWKVTKLVYEYRSYNSLAHISWTDSGKVETLFHSLGFQF